MNNNKIQNKLMDIQIMLESAQQVLSDNSDYLNDDLEPSVLKFYQKSASRRHCIAEDYIHRANDEIEKMQKLINESEREG